MLHISGTLNKELWLIAFFSLAFLWCCKQDSSRDSEEESAYMADYATQAERELCIWRASYKDGKGIIRGQLMISGDRYYGIQAFGYDDDKSNDLMRKFFESFQITDIQKQ